MDDASVAGGAAELVPDDTEPVDALPVDPVPVDPVPVDVLPVDVSPEDDTELEAGVAAVVSLDGLAAVSAG
jgi:hypothetical protein